MEETTAIQRAEEFIPRQTIELILDIRDWIRKGLGLIILELKINTKSKFVSSITLGHDDRESERTILTIFNDSLFQQRGDLRFHLLEDGV